MDYQEQQSFHPIIYISTLVIVAAVIGGLVLTGGAPTWIAWIYIAGLLVLFNFLWVSTTIDRHILKVRFGLAVPYFRKLIPLSEIEEARIIDYRPIRDGGGWGIKCGRFEGTTAWFYTARGTRGVYIKTANARRIIGSQQPEKLLRAIERKRKG